MVIILLKARRILCEKWFILVLQILKPRNNDGQTRKQTKYVPLGKGNCG